MKIENNFEIRQIVYLKHDIEQLPRMITAIKINPYDITYELACGTDVTSHYDFEIYKEKTVF